MGQALSSIGDAKLSSEVTVGSRNKKTSNADFADQLQRVMQSGSNTLTSAANKAIPFVPGSAIISSAVSEAAGAIQNSPSAGSALPMLNGVSGGGSFSGGGGGPGGGFPSEMGNMERDTISANVALLQMQQRFQMLGVQFTGISNAMKADHDAKKNSISNIR